MSIKIRVKQELRRGEKVVKILKIEGLEELQLPVEYFRAATPENPAISVRWNRLFFGDEIALRVGDQYLPEEVDFWVEVCKKAGERLKKINETLKKENLNWTKEITYII